MPSRGGAGDDGVGRTRYPVDRLSLNGLDKRATGKLRAITRKLAVPPDKSQFRYFDGMEAEEYEEKAICH